MKKYFIKGTELELKIGDVVELNFIRVKGDDENEIFSLDKEVDEELLKQYLEEGFLECYQDNLCNEDFEEDEEDMIAAIIEANEELEKRTDNLEDELKRVKKALNLLIKENKRDKFESNSIKE